VGIVGIEERVRTSLGLVPCEDAFGLGDVAQELRVDLLQLGLPEVSRLAAQGLPLGPEHLAAWAVEGPECLWAAIAMCAAAEAARYAALPSAGLVRERPRLAWLRGRVIWFHSCDLHHGCGSACCYRQQR
jgi:hypothetical protein